MTGSSSVSSSYFHVLHANTSQGSRLRLCQWSRDTVGCPTCHASNSNSIEPTFAILTPYPRKPQQSAVAFPSWLVTLRGGRISQRGRFATVAKAIGILQHSGGRPSNVGGWLLWNDGSSPCNRNACRRHYCYRMRNSKMGEYTCLEVSEWKIELRSTSDLVLPGQNHMDPTWTPAR